MIGNRYYRRLRYGRERQAWMEYGYNSCGNVLNKQKGVARFCGRESFFFLPSVLSNFDIIIEKSENIVAFKADVGHFLGRPLT